MISDSWIKIFYSGAFVTGAGPRRGQVAPGRTRAGPGPDSGRARAGIQIIVKADGQALSGGWTSPQRSYAADARDVPVRKPPRPRGRDRHRDGDRDSVAPASPD